MNEEELKANLESINHSLRQLVLKAGGTYKEPSLFLRGKE